MIVALNIIVLILVVYIFKLENKQDRYCKGVDEFTTNVEAFAKDVTKYCTEVSEALNTQQRINTEVFKLVSNIKNNVPKKEKIKDVEDGTIH